MLAAKSIFWRCISYWTCLDFPASHGSFRWTNSIINPLLLNFPDPFFGCVVATGWCTKICKFDWVMWYAWPVKETLGSWATWNKQPRGKCDHDHSQLILQKAVQNPQLTSRFCCVFQRVNSCTPLKIKISPEKTENWWLEKEILF